MSPSDFYVLRSTVMRIDRDTAARIAARPATDDEVGKWIRKTSSAPPAAAPPAPGLAAAAMGAVALAGAASGMARVPREIAHERYETCRQCPRLSIGQCLECSCLVAGKVWAPSAGCPLGRWSPLTTSAGSGGLGGPLCG